MDSVFQLQINTLLKTSNYKAAKQLLLSKLESYPNDISIMYTLGNIEYSLQNIPQSEYYFKECIAHHPQQSVNARMRLLNIYAMQGNYNKLFIQLQQALEIDPKSFTLKQQLIEVYMNVFEFDEALKISRLLIEQSKTAVKKQKKKEKKSKKNINSNNSELKNEIPHTKQELERIQELINDNNRSEWFFLHSQILSKLGRFSDARYYCKKALEILQSWMASLPISLQNKYRNVKITSLGIRKYRYEQQQNKVGKHESLVGYKLKLNQMHGYLGLCHLNMNEIELALKSFQIAIQINPNDRIAISNMTTVPQNRAIFQECEQLQKVYNQYKSKHLIVEDMEECFMKYLQLLLQTNRRVIARQLCEYFINVAKVDECDYNSDSDDGIRSVNERKMPSKRTTDDLILSYRTSKFIIVFEGILRQDMNEMIEKWNENSQIKIEDDINLRAENGPQQILLENQQYIKEHILLQKIFDIRVMVDQMYSRTLSVNANETSVYIAYSLCLWRIGYNCDGISKKTNEWLVIHPLLEKEMTFYLARGNAFINEERFEEALVEIQNAIKIIEEQKSNTNNDGKSEEIGDEIQARVLLVVVLNGLNHLQLACKECECILAIDANHSSTRKLYAAVLQKLKRYSVMFLVHF